MLQMRFSLQNYNKVTVQTRKKDKSACLKHILRRGRANLYLSVKVKIYLPPPNMDFNVTNITLLYKIQPRNEKQVLYTEM